LMELIMNANPSSGPLYLIDTRPRMNAMINKVQGKGFENTRNYTNMHFHFFDIDNIHVMRSSLSKLLEAFQTPQTMSQYLKIVDSSGWLRHLRSIVECGKFIAESITRGTSCVVHCSDGWDRTAQTVSLAQIILDPFYRTITGFQVLIEKDWLGFGHKFDDRCDHLGSNSDESNREVSPIFVQFLDTVYQIMRRKPLVFEFNERFLLLINEHAYSMLYGNFLGNCDKDRKDLRITTRTKSLWAYMDSSLDDFINPFYEKNDFLPHDVDLKPSSFVVWSTMYNKFDTGVHPREYIIDLAMNAKQRVGHLQRILENRTLNGSKMAIKWCPLLNSEECSGPKCHREFESRFSRRLFCSLCGKVFCHRCLNREGEDHICNECIILIV